MQDPKDSLYAARRRSWLTPRALFLLTVFIGGASSCRSLDRKSGFSSALDDAADAELSRYEALRVQSLTATLQCRDFTAKLGVEVTQRVRGQAVAGKIRLLRQWDDRPVYLAADFNDWGRSKTEADRLLPDPLAPEYLVATVRKLHHGMEYHLVIDGVHAIDPFAMAFAPTFWHAKEDPSSTLRNAIFWDFDRKEASSSLAAVADLRSKALVMGSADVMSLAQGWGPGDRQGPLFEKDTYRFVAQSGLVQTLADAGYNALLWMPLQLHGEKSARFGQGDVASLFAPDARFGSPDDFLFMVDAFNRAGISVIMESALGRPSLARGDGGRYDLTKPEVQNLVSDATLHLMCRYGIGGIHFGRVDEILSRGDEGANFLKELVARLRAYRPEAMIIARSSAHARDTALLTSLEYGGFGMNYRMHDELSHALRAVLVDGASDVAMQHVRDAMHRRPNLGEAARLSSVAYEPAFLGAPEFYAERRIKALASLAFLSNSAYADQPQVRLMQPPRGPGDRAVDWSLRERGAGARTWDYFADLSRYVTSRRAFAFSNYPGEGESRVEDEGGRRLVSLTRRDRLTGKCIHVLVNLGHVGYNVYGVGTDHPGSYRVVFDSDAERYGGSGELSRRLKSRVVMADGMPLHGKKTSLSLPYVAPYAAVILEQD